MVLFKLLLWSQVACVTALLLAAVLGSRVQASVAPIEKKQNKMNK